MTADAIDMNRDRRDRGKVEEGERGEKEKRAVLQS
jgi:hypothetical protein